MLNGEPLFTPDEMDLVDLAIGDRRQITSGSGNQRPPDVSEGGSCTRITRRLLPEVRVYDIDAETPGGVYVSVERRGA
jgi:hypothetical protein